MTWKPKTDTFKPMVATEAIMNWGDGTKKIRAVVIKETARDDPTVILEEGFTDAIGNTSWVKICAIDSKEKERMFSWLLFNVAINRINKR